MDLILLRNIAASVDAISAVLVLTEMREVAKEQYETGAISKNEYYDFLKVEIKLLKSFGGDSND